MDIISKILFKIFRFFFPSLKTPFLTVDGIVEIYDENNNFKGIVLIERKNPPFGFALPGGFVEYGESPEKAILREIEEEIGVKAEIIRLFGVYGEPDRDPRFHTVTCVYILKTKEKPKASSDAKRVYIFDFNNIPFDKIVFDHGKIIRDYLKFKGTLVDKDSF
ncbi:MAG: NUDIX hydrolase [candidate division WOR-3 bacterium]